MKLAIQLNPQVSMEKGGSLLNYLNNTSPTSCERFIFEKYISLDFTIAERVSRSTGVFLGTDAVSPSSKLVVMTKITRRPVLLCSIEILSGDKANYAT